MNRKFDPKKESVVEEALKLKDEGKRLSYIIAKFPDYESEIREVFGTVAFIRENDGKVSVPKNILKTLLSKMTDSSSFQPKTHLKKEVLRENNFYIPAKEETEDEGIGNEVPASESNLSLHKWKIIVSVAVLSIVMVVILLRSDPAQNVEVINENMEASLDAFDASSTFDSSEIASSTETDSN